MRGQASDWRRFGLLAGTVGVTVLTAASAFADADDPLSGSDTAIILGGTFESTPDTAFAQAAENLYLHPLGFDDGATSSTVCDMVGTDPCAAPLQVLTTPELIQESPSTLTDADDITLAVENEFTANPGAFSAEDPLTIFGYSQSAAAESVAMTQLAKDGIPSADLHFVFIGDPSLPSGIGPNLMPDLDSVYGSSQTDTVLTDLGLSDLGVYSVLANATPDNLYPATIYTLDGDGVADYQQDFAAGGLLDSLYNLFTTHAEYLGLTPTQIADATTSIDGDLTNIDISDNINGFDALIGALENGIGSSGLFESLFQSLELYLTNTF
ncbi:MAG: PE-PPE domain-containing protein [Mycobacterium sp.]